MKVIYILPHLEPPPFEERRHDRLYREQQMVLYTRRLGIECDMYFLTFQSECYTSYNVVESHAFPVNNPRTGDKKSYVSNLLLRSIEKEKPDLVVFKGMGYRLSRWLLVNSKHKFRIAFIVGGGTSDLLTPYADYVLAENESQIDRNFRQIASMGRAAILPKLNLPFEVRPSLEKKFDVINVGSFNTNKNQAALLPLLRKYRVAMIGDGELYEEVKSLAEIYPRENLYMPGNIPRSDVAALISQSRLMVHTARSEGLPRVVMEAFACGVPVVASKRAMPGAFEDGIHGLLVEPNEIISAAQALLSDDVRLQKMGQEAYAYAKSQSSNEVVFEATRDMYNKVFSESQPFHCTVWDLFFIRIRSVYLEIGRLLLSFARILRRRFNRIKKFGISLRWC